MGCTQARASPALHDTRDTNLANNDRADTRYHHTEHVARVQVTARVHRRRLSQFHADCGSVVVQHRADCGSVVVQHGATHGAASDRATVTHSYVPQCNSYISPQLKAAAVSK